jgi:hypothetical protein
MARPQRQSDQRGSKIVRFKEIQARARRRAMPAMDPDDERRRIRTNIAGLFLAALLIAIGWILVQKLSQSSHLQDCLMSGRTNCDPIPTPPAE